MPRIEDQVRIEAPAAEVWRVLADFGSVHRFNPIVKHSYLTSEQTCGVGTGRRCEMAPFGSVEETVTEWREGERLVFRMDDARNLPPFAAATGAFTLTADGDGATRVDLVVELTPRAGFLGRLADVLLLRPKFRQAVPGLLAALKRHCETGR